MREHRRFERYPFSVEVEITYKGMLRKKRQRYFTRDMSDGGVFLQGKGKDCPPVGTLLEARIAGPDGGEVPPVVKARVVRVDPDGMAIAFLPPAKHGK